MAGPLIQCLLLLCLLPSQLPTGVDPFAGKWRLNPSKSHFIDEMKIESIGANKYNFVFAGTSGEPIVADGTDQPGVAGTMLSVTVQDSHTWTVVRKKDGRMLLTARWTLSDDGRTLRDAFTGFQSDGSSSTTNFVYQRTPTTATTAGTSGFPGSWESTTPQFGSDYELEIRPYEGNGLSLITPAEGTTRNLTFDGSDYPNPGIAQGFTVSGRRVDERGVDVTEKMRGRVLYTREIRLSPDARTLTMTVHQTGQTKPNVLVFDRE